MFSNYVELNESEVKLLVLSDKHIGNKFIDKNYLEKVKQYIENEKPRILLLGDIIESCTRTSVGKGIFDEEYHLEKQVEEVVSLFSNYSDLIDGVVTGNHEERVAKEVGFDITKHICKLLGIESKYAGYSGINVYSTPTFNYSIFFTHGSSSASTEAAVINSLLKLREIARADIYVQGHSHARLDISREIYYPMYMECEKAKQYFVSNGSLLKYTGGYGQMKNLTIKEGGMTVIKMNSKGVRACKLEDLV